MKATAATATALVLVLVAGTTACTSGTTPVCDDAGSCLLLSPSSDSGGGPAEEGGQAEGSEGGEDGGTD